MGEVALGKGKGILYYLIDKGFMYNIMKANVGTWGEGETTRIQTSRAYEANDKKSSHVVGSFSRCSNPSLRYCASTSFAPSSSSSWVAFLLRLHMTPFSLCRARTRQAKRIGENALMTEEAELFSI